MNFKLTKILLVESFLDNIELVNEILNKEYTNYIIEITKTKKGFKKAIKSYKPDIILSNNIFPDFEGISIFKTAKKHVPTTPFIFVSYPATEQKMDFFLKNGLTDFVFKDNLNSLGTKMKTALNKMEKNNANSDSSAKAQSRVEELEKKEYLYRTLVENTEAIYAVVDENLNPIYRSPLIEKITGWTLKEIRGYDIFEIIHPQDRDLAYDFLEELKNNPEQIIPSSFRLKLKNGNYCWFEGTGNNQLSNPKLNGLIFKFSDVSNRKQMESELAGKEAKYRAVFENSLDGILLSQTDGRIIKANPSACRMFKMTEKEIISLGRDGLFDKTDNRFESLVRERTNTGCAVGEATFIHKGGSTFSAFVSTSKFIDSFQRERISISIHDISERIRSKEKLDNTTHLLKETVNRLNKTLDASTDVICTVDSEGKFVDVNAASLKSWGYTQEELKGTNFLNLVFHEDLGKTSTEAARVKNGCQSEFFENRYVHKNGSIVHNLWSATWDHEDELVFCTSKDVTDKKKLEKGILLEKERFRDLYEQAPSAMGILKGPNHIYELATPPLFTINIKNC